MKAVLALTVLAATAVARMMVSHDEIAHINSVQNLWVAAPNPISSLPEAEARALLGTKLPEEVEDYEPLPAVNYEGGLQALPTKFDARTNWPSCSVIKQIRNQRNCGSCWAFSSVEAMTDRECIVNKVNKPLSSEDVLSCSKNSIFSCGNCKNGGQPSCAWKWYTTTGVVSEKCRPYTAGLNDSDITPACETKCADSSITYSKDKTIGKSSYTLKGETNMMNDLYQHGPITVAFKVYKDFYSYSTGIYKHTSGDYLGGHAVKAIGWGVENGTKYWLIANSWGDSWGEKGFFRIVRGTNECNIEAEAWAGMPKSQ